MLEKMKAQAAYLSLDRLAFDPRLARLLPPDLARRFRALPLAEENGRITVAMADPADGQARDAVMTALGPASCLVQADASLLDRLLSQVWGCGQACRPEVLVCSYPRPPASEVLAYARSLSELLDAGLRQLHAAETLDTLLPDQVGRGLVLFETADHPLIAHLLSQREPPPTPSPLGDVPLGVLVARQPRWPLRRILLVIQGQATDDAALDWALHLGRAAGSHVTVLAVVPPVPAMYDGCAAMRHSLPALLSTDSTLGRQLRRICHRLVDWEVEGALKLRQGVPEAQIRREAEAGDYDLVAVAAAPGGRWRRYLEGDLVGHLLRWAGQPLLVARPTTA